MQPVGELEDGEIILSNLSCDDGEGGPCQFESRSTNANVMWQRIPNEWDEDGISDTSIFSGKPLPVKLNQGTDLSPIVIDREAGRL